MTDTSSVNPFDQIDPKLQAAAQPPAVNDNPYDKIGPDIDANASALGAFGRSAARGTAPAVGGLAGVGPGAETGAAIGAAIPVLGETGISEAVGAVIGGIGGAFAGGDVVNRAQDWALSQLPDSWQEALGQSDRQQRLDAATHGTAAFLGGLTPYALTMRPGGFGGAAAKLPANATALQRILANPTTARLFGGGIQGGMEAGQEAANGEDPDWAHIAIATGFGLVFNKPTRLGEAIENIGARPTRALLGRPEPDVTTLAQAGDAKVLGPGMTESVFQGTQEPDAATAMTAQEAVRTEDAILRPDQTQPDIHGLARRIDPDTFAAYDDLSARRDTFRDWLGELSNPSDETVGALTAQQQELQTSLDGEKNRAEQRRLRAQIRDVQSQIDDATQRREGFASGEGIADTPEMATVRQRLQDVDYQMRDLAPNVSAAYRRANEMIGNGEELPPPPVAATEPEPGTPTPEQTTEVPGVPIEAQKASIASDVSSKLVSAGRPQEEADAAGQLLASYYETRAARFEGVEPGALYAAEAPKIKSGESVARAREFAQPPDELAQEAKGKIRINQARSTITLFKSADASTFIHETGHQWLEDLVKDAAVEGVKPQVKTDANTTRAYLGNKGGDLTRGQHEKFARAFEQYMREGVAPSKGLANVFAQFRGWLTKIYQTIAKLGTPINEDIRQVFDRMLSTNPERTVIAPERPKVTSLADIHEADARETEPHEAEPAMDRVSAEATRYEEQQPPEVRNEIAAAEAKTASPAEPAGEGSGGAGTGAEVSGDRTEPGTQPAGSGGRAEPGKVVDSGGNVGAEGAPSRGTEDAARRANLNASPYVPVPKPPLSLVDFLKANGGIADDIYGAHENTARGRAEAERKGSDLTAIGARDIKGLIRPKAGMTPEIALRKAIDAGYLPESAWNDTGEGGKGSTHALTEAIADEISGNKRYSEKDQSALEAHEAAKAANAEIDRLADELGIDIKGMTAAQFDAAISEHMSIEQQSRWVADHEGPLEDRLQDAMDRAQNELGDAWEGDPTEYDISTPRTFEDLENAAQTQHIGSSAGNAGEVSANASGSETGLPADHSASRSSGSDASQSGSQNGQSDRNVTGSNLRPDSNAAGPNTILPRSESRLVDKAGNIRIDNLTTKEDVARAIREAAEENDDFIGDRRGKITDGQADDLASALGMTPTFLLRRKLGDAFNAEQVLAARKLLIQSATQVGEAMKKADGGTDADVIAYAEAKDRHQMIQAQVAGITAEAGRALRAFRNIAGNEAAEAVNEFIKRATGKTLFQLREEIRLGKQYDTPAKISKFMNDATKRTFGRMVLEYWINGLISGPATHTTYMVGNTMLLLEKAGPETALAAGIGNLRAAFGREGERVHAGEVGAQLKGFLGSLPAATEASLEALRSGVTTTLPGEDARPQIPFSGDNQLVAGRSIENTPVSWHDVGSQAFGMIRGMRDALVANGALLAAGGIDGAPLIGAKYSPLGYIPDVAIRGVNVLPVGTLARAPSRAIAAIHSFYRTLNFSMEKAAIAYRTASEEGLTGNDFAARVADIRSNPSQDVMERSAGAANQLTLMSKGGEFTQAMSRLTNTEIFGFPILKFIDPFVHIASNVIDQSLIQRTPLGWLAPEVRADLLGKNGNVAQDMAMARMAVGTVLSITFGGLAAQGLASGSGPADPKQAAMWRLAGNQAHSVRVGDIWYDVHRLGPLGMLMGVAADMYDVSHAMNKEDASEIGKSIMHALTQNILDESFMRGPAELIQAIEDPDRYGSSYVRSFLSSFTPYSVGMAQMARASDPYSRQARTIMDAVRAKIPGMSEGLLPRRDIWGEPMPNREALIAKGLTAIYESKMSTDPVNLAMVNLGIGPAQPERKIRNVQLTDQEYDDYSRIAGRMTKGRLDVIVRSPDFVRWPATTQHDVIEQVIRECREASRGVIMAKYPHIAKDATVAKLAPFKTPASEP